MSDILEVKNISVSFAQESSFWRGLLGKGKTVTSTTVLNDVSLNLRRGDSLGIVGESGCGKSTLARALVGLTPVTSGTIMVDQIDVTRQRDRALSRRVQMIFQDPSSSLNPALTIGQMLSELLLFHNLVERDKVRSRCEDLMNMVHLPQSILDRRPQRLSGGQRQRIGIARALALEPEILIADESVAALDVSVQATVLNLLKELKERLNLTLVFISHDLGVIRHISDRVAVIYLGKIVEEGLTEQVFNHPSHPYTRALISAAPNIQVMKQPGQSRLVGETPSLSHLPSGCYFSTRCIMAQDICRQIPPPQKNINGHKFACHFEAES